MFKVRKKFIVEPFPNRTLSDIWYNLKLSYKMFKTFFWYIWWFRGYDSHYMLQILKISIEVMIESHINARNKHVGQEDTIKQMQRCVELLGYLIEDDYEERCGYDYNYEIDFIPTDETEKWFSMVDNKTPEQEANNKRAMAEAKELKDKERIELFDTIRDNYGSWWH